MMTQHCSHCGHNIDEHAGANADQDPRFAGLAPGQCAQPDCDCDGRDEYFRGK